jgi:transmembrane sensor
MTAIEERVRDLIAQQAADWFVANRGQPSSRERAEFAAWLKASPVHVEEYLGLAALTRDLRQACAELADSVDSVVADAKRAEVRTLWPRVLGTAPRMFGPLGPAAAVTVASIAVLCLGFSAWWSFRLGSPMAATDTVATAHFETRHGEQQTHRLSDGTVVHLNTDSAVTVRYDRSERVVMLTAGEADFEVTHQAKRPFRVFAASAEIADIGTQFDVRLEPGSTLVTVIDGKVAVAPSSIAHESSGPSQAWFAEFVEVAADQQISVSQGAWPAAPISVDAHRSTSWLRRQISFDHEPLSRVATEFNRYSAKPIEIDTPALQDMEISGAFATDDAGAFIAFLRSLDGVRVEVTSTRIRVTRDEGSSHAPPPGSKANPRAL